MDGLDVRSVEEPRGWATFEMANLRPQRTGLPFIVFISQRGHSQHAARVIVSPAPKVREDQMSSYAVSPFEHKSGPRLTSQEERSLEAWIVANRQVLAEYWDGDIEYTEDAIERLVKP